MKFFLLAGLILFLRFNSAAQIDSKDLLTDNFAFSIQTIDDFFDHFNFEPNTESFQYFRSRYPGQKLDRRTIIRALFDSKNDKWNNSDLNEFACQFESEESFKLHFEQEGWYAIIHCNVIYLKKHFNVDLVMKVEGVTNKGGTKGYKWSIVSIMAPFIQNSGIHDRPDSTNYNPQQNTGSFLHPMSDAMSFMNIDDIFRIGATRMYFANKISSPELDTLVALIDHSKIKFVQVDSVCYYLFQLPNWILEVKYFNRLGNNSGWLISQLISATENEKKDYLLKYLNIK